MAASLPSSLYLRWRRRASAQRRHALTGALPSLSLELALVAAMPAMMAAPLAAAAADRARRSLLLLYR